MDQNFKCRSCGIIFQADSDHEVKCPACSSDNLEIAKIKKSGGLKMTLLIAGIAFIVAIGVGIAIKYIVVKEQEYNAFEDDVVAVTQDNDVVDILEAVDTDPETVILDPRLELDGKVVADNKTKTYSFTIKCTNLPSGATVSYKLYDFATHRMVMTSDNGHFTNVPPATDDAGAYVVEATVKTATNSVTITKDVTGCLKFPEKADKLTVAEVQQLVNKMIAEERASYLSSNPRISQSVALIFTDMRGEQPPTGISGLLSRIQMGIWSGLKVISLGYEDSTNRVNKITFQPIWED